MDGKKLRCPKCRVSRLNVELFPDDYDTLNWVQVMCGKCNVTVYYNGA